ncbi:MAG: substrate-binding domain-containing protein [Verrucomicrobia bacterium]|nr:substrate-binding domain-containing protein [Verrucomicrobiota bacterium]
MGFDDLPMAAYSSPRLTTVATQAIAQGEQAALAAMELLNGQKVGKRNCNLSLEFIVRESCGAVPSRKGKEAL